MLPQFAIVRKQSPYTFHNFKPTFEEAQSEAERLCRKERVPFMVIAIVATVNPVEVPVKWDIAPGWQDEVEPA